MVLTWLALGAFGSSDQNGYDGRREPTSHSPEHPPLSIDKYACSRPQSAEQQNLCIQWDAAKAAQQQAIWAAATFGIGIAGTIALLVTLFFTKRATDAATRQAAAAERVLSDVERPWIFVHEVDQITYWEDMFWAPCVTYTVTNHGKTPAIIQAMLIGCAWTKEEAFAANASKSDKLVTKHILGAGEQVADLEYVLAGFEDQLVGCHYVSGPPGDTPETGNPDYFRLKERGARLFFRVVIRYDSPFRKGYETSAAWEIGGGFPHTTRFHKSGGDDYTYQK